MNHVIVLELTTKDLVDCFIDLYWRKRLREALGEQNQNRELVGMEKIEAVIEKMMPPGFEEQMKSLGGDIQAAIDISQVDRNLMRMGLDGLVKKVKESR